MIDNLANAKNATMKYINNRIDKFDGELTVLKKELNELNLSDAVDDEKIVEKLSGSIDLSCLYYYVLCIADKHKNTVKE